MSNPMTKRDEHAPCMQIRKYLSQQVALRQDDPAAALQAATATSLYELSAALDEAWQDMQQDEVRCGWVAHAQGGAGRAALSAWRAACLGRGGQNWPWGGGLAVERRGMQQGQSLRCRP